MSIKEDQILDSTLMQDVVIKRNAEAGEQSTRYCLLKNEKDSEGKDQHEIPDAQKLFHLIRGWNIHNKGVEYH